MPMPSLLSINNYHYRRGGAEVVYLEQNRLFEEAGWQVVPFAMRHKNNLKTQWSAYFADEIEFDVSYSFWQKIQRVPKVICSREASSKLHALLDLARPDVAHAHNVYHHLSPAIFKVLKAHGIPSFLTLHDLKLACPAYKMLAPDGICERCKGGALRHVVLNRCVKSSLALSGLIWLESTIHRLLNCYDANVSRFVVPSRFYLDKLVEWGWDQSRFVYVPNFVDAQALQPQYQPGTAFLYFGRLSQEKGLVTLLHAAAQARVPLWIVGTGPDEKALRELAETLRTRTEIRFFGYQTGIDLHRLIQQARAVVLPSEWYENAPMSVMEAYALGKPVIGSAIGGIPELIRPDLSGAVFPAGNQEALAAVLRRFASLPDGTLIEMGRHGRQWVKQDFSPARYRERLTELYSGAR